jgi:hypothetical protein
MRKDDGGKADVERSQRCLGARTLGQVGGHGDGRRRQALAVMGDAPPVEGVPLAGIGSSRAASARFPRVVAQGAQHIGRQSVGAHQVRQESFRLKYNLYTEYGRKTSPKSSAKSKLSNRLRRPGVAWDSCLVAIVSDTRLLKRKTNVDRLPMINSLEPMLQAISAETGCAHLVSATGSVLQVGGGRGFVVEAAHYRYIVTAAHCLPFFSPCFATSDTRERTYEDLVAPLGQARTIWAECVFVDPIADIAVLGQPDGQELPDKWEAYNSLTDAAVALPIGEVSGGADAFLLGLDGEWMTCRVHAIRGIMVSEACCGIVNGMSGSPIVSADGAAIGVVSLSQGSEMEIRTEGGPQASLAAHLPGWLLRELRRV